MRVGVVTTSYPRGPGCSAGVFVAEHVAWLRGAGHEVEVVAAGDDAAEIEAEAGVTRVPAGGDLFYAGGAPEALTAGPRAWPAALAFGARLALTVAVRARRWDAIVAHWLAPSALAAVAATRLPVLAIAHSGDVHLLARTRLLGAAAAALDRPRVRLAFVSAGLEHRFLAAAPEPRRARLRGRSTVAPMGIDVARLAAAVAEPRGPRPRVVFVGRLVDIKGVDVLLEAVARLPASVDLVIAGAGPAEAALRQRADELGLAADFRGAVAPAARDRLLASADLVVLPSRPVGGGREEGAPLVAREAMAAGAAVIASASGGLGELPTDVARLLPPGDPARLAAALAELIADPGLRQRQIEAAKRWIDRADWRVTGEALWRWLDTAERPVSRFRKAG